MYNPLTGPMSTVVRVQTRTKTDVNGAAKFAYTDAGLDACQWKSKGGTEATRSGVLAYEDTAEVVMWYRSDITIRDRLLLDDVTAYEIISPPENIEQRGQYLMFKVQRVGGA